MIAFVCFPAYIAWWLLRGPISSNVVTNRPSLFLYIIGILILSGFVISEYKHPDKNIGIAMFGLLSVVIYYYKKRKIDKN